MIQVHALKIQKEFADAICSGDKTFELRKNDRGFQKGDLIRFKVIQSDTYAGTIYNYDHLLNEQTYEITYVLDGWGMKEGYVALGIKLKGELK